jgi:hypothetical protein
VAPPPPRPSPPPPPPSCAECTGGNGARYARAHYASGRATDDPSHTFEMQYDEFCVYVDGSNGFAAGCKLVPGTGQFGAGGRFGAGATSYVGEDLPCRTRRRSTRRRSHEHACDPVPATGGH